MSDKGSIASHQEGNHSIRSGRRRRNFRESDAYEESPGRERSPDPGSLVAQLDGSERRVLMFRLADSAAEIVATALGRQEFTAWPSAVASALFITAISLTVLASLAMGGGLGFANVDVPFYVLVTSLMLVWSRDTWARFAKLESRLDALVADKEERARAARMIASRLHLVPQALAASLGALVGVLCAVLSVRAGRGSLLSDLPFLLSMFVTGSIGASVVYWLWAGVTFLSRLAKLESIALAGEHEGHPLIRDIYSIASRARLRVGIGLCLSEVPLLVLAHSAPHSGVLAGATVTVFVLCSATLAAIGVGPDIYVGRICRKSQDSEIEALELRRHELATTAGYDAFVADCALRQTVAAIRSRPVRHLSASTFANVLAASAAALLPFVALLVKFGLHL